MQSERNVSKAVVRRAVPTGRARRHRQLYSASSNTSGDDGSNGWNQLPPEIVVNILSMLDTSTDQAALVQCLFVNRVFHRGAKEALYSRPHFTSTYRVAQFISCLRQCESNGLLVKHLDLSGLRNGDSASLAGWRDWRLRHVTPVRSRRPSSVVSMESGSTTGSARGYRSNSSVSSLSSSSGGSGESLGEPQSKWVSLWTKFKRSGRDKVQRKPRQTRQQMASPSPHLLTHSRSRSSSSATHSHANRGMMSQYTAYKDLPLGHVLHLLRLCRNLVHLDLSHLAISADFELPLSGQPQPKSMVPGVSVEPRAMYLTDSSRPLENSAQLKKLNPEQVFDFLLDNPSIRNVRMDHIVWVRQSMVADYVLRSYHLQRTAQLSFNRSGLQRHLAWTCQGDLQDLVALVLMDYVAGLDNLALQQLFPTNNNAGLLHPDIMEISQVFEVPLSKEGVFPTRLTILKAETTKYRLRRLCPKYLSLVVLLGESSPAVQNVVDKRLYRRARTVSKRLKELRNTDLRRSLGQNYLLPGAGGMDL